MELEIKYKRQTLILLYSPEDDELIKSHEWKVNRDFYPFTTINIDGKNFIKKCHRMIMNVNDPSVIVDHINGDELDVRRENLRIATVTENGRNKAKAFGTKYKFKGIGTKRGRYTANISVNGKLISKGGFKIIEDAARLYDSMAIYYYGDYARLNFPEEETSDFQKYLDSIEERKQKSKEKNQFRIKTINDILIKNNGNINIRIIKDFLKEQNIELSRSMRHSFMQQMNKMVASGTLRVEKLTFDINNTMNNYFLN